jgi:hypothetical protein
LKKYGPGRIVFTDRPDRFSDPGQEIGFCVRDVSVQFISKIPFFRSVIGFFFFVLALGTLYDLVLYQPRLAEMQSDVTIIDVRTSYPPIGTAAADATYNAQVHPQDNDEARVDQGNTEDDDAPLLQNHSDAAVKETKRVVTKVITPEVGTCQNFTFAIAKVTF